MVLGKREDDVDEWDAKCRRQRRQSLNSKFGGHRPHAPLQSRPTPSRPLPFDIGLTLVGKVGWLVEIAS